MSAREHVILVDTDGHEIGTAEKMRAHQEGKLHRAISICITDRRGRFLLQKRANLKYHSGGLWSNACCSHPRPGESVKDAAHRRLQEEMGFDCPLREVAVLLYSADVGNGLREYEYDHILIGRYEGPIAPNPYEVSDWQWMPRKALDVELVLYPERYTLWLPLLLERLAEKRRKRARTTGVDKNNL